MNFRGILFSPKHHPKIIFKTDFLSYLIYSLVQQWNHPFLIGLKLFFIWIAIMPNNWLCVLIPTVLLSATFFLLLNMMVTWLSLTFTAASSTTVLMAFWPQHNCHLCLLVANEYELAVEISWIWESELRNSQEKVRATANICQKLAEPLRDGNNSLTVKKEKKE